VTVEEGLVPGSILLGYVNADHWELAIGIERELEFIAGRPVQRPLLRTGLSEAILRDVGDDL
jgi:hypothetical protein